ncbi:KGGVGR-motif variant AAA ATPase [Desulfococcus sp.]|uniref:KGGVGR-motif variant AAA ATPase n=1 Tax=Desulfococcus sp. TaxID=2025834 RepID=UPI003593F29B
MNTKTMLFAQALTAAIEKVKQAGNISKEITLVRDLRGRIRVLLPIGEDDYKDKKDAIVALGADLSMILGNYGFPPETMVLYSKNLAVADSELNDRVVLYQGKGMTIHLLDRQIIGQDWLKDSYNRTTSNPRAAFFGIKGGVGRSTALVIWAWRLAKQGKKVLIFDLDLESPGVSSTILPKELLSDFGIVDWFVEDGVGQAAFIEREMIAISPVARELSGEIRIVPAFGRKTDEYLPKLARCYADTASANNASWGNRLERMVTLFEESERPDIVILDSRAGIHDIAATVITRMDAQSFLFAVDSSQTWKAYSFLFSHWKRHPGLASIREKLQIVASMVPETDRDEYLKRFREHSWDLFRDYLYDEAAATAEDAFNFDLNNEEAPHYPLPVFWHRALQEFNPAASSTGIGEKTAVEALGIFMDAADRLVMPTDEESGL